MQQDLNRVIDQVSKEKGMDRGVIIEALESAMLSAARRTFGQKQIEAKFNPDIGEIELFEIKTVVEQVALGHAGIDFPGAIELVSAIRIEARMQQHVVHREDDLAQRAEPALEILCGDHLVEELARQFRASVDVRRHIGQHVPLPAEVFEELRRQLDGVPFDAVDARDAQLAYAREHVMQPVPELVK